MEPEVRERLIEFDNRRLMEGRGLLGFITVAIDAFRKGMRLDPEPLADHQDRTVPVAVSALSDLAIQTRDRRLTKERFVARGTKLLMRAALHAYNAGIKSVDSKAKIEKSDENVLARMVSSQVPFLTNWADQLRAGTGKMPIPNRSDLYGLWLDSVFIEAAVSRMPRDVLIYWKLSKAEHCPTCLALSKNGPYTPETLPTFPRRGDTECMMGCKCTLEVTTSFRKGFLSLLQRLGLVAP